MNYLNKFLQNDKKLPINHSWPNKFLEFDYKAIQNPLAHTSCEMYFYIPYQVNFENRALIRIFSHLYLVYGGFLYDRLRDELGLIYSMDGYFDKDISSLVINLNCEKDDWGNIYLEIKKVFTNFDEYFKPQKFLDLKESMIKKQMLAKDRPESISSFINQTLRMYGTLEDYDSFLLRLKDVSEDQIKNMCQELTSSFSTSRLVLVSKDHIDMDSFFEAQHDTQSEVQSETQPKVQKSEVQSEVQKESV